MVNNNQHSTSCFIDTDQILCLTEEDYFKRKINKAIIGKFLYDEFNAMPPNANENDIDVARKRAHMKADMVAEIILSGALAQELINLLGGSVESFKKFLHQYLQSNCR